MAAAAEGEQLYPCRSSSSFACCSVASLLTNDAGFIALGRNNINDENKHPPFHCGEGEIPIIGVSEEDHEQPILSASVFGLCPDNVVVVDSDERWGIDEHQAPLQHHRQQEVQQQKRSLFSLRENPRFLLGRAKVKVPSLRARIRNEVEKQLQQSRMEAVNK